MSAADDRGRKAPCSYCGDLTSLADDNPWRPFCSQRCKTTDLGAWLSDRYSVAADQDDDFTPPGTPLQ